MPRKHSLLNLGYEYTGVYDNLYLCIFKKTHIQVLKMLYIIRENPHFPFPFFLRWNIISFYIFSEELFLNFLVIFFHIFQGRGLKPLGSNAWYEVELYIIIIEIGYTIHVMCLNYPKTNHPHGRWRNCLPRNGFLVPEKLGTTGLKHIEIIRYIGPRAT